MNTMEATNLQAYSDEEAVLASGLQVPSLRALQSAGAIRSDKPPKARGQGARRRIWREADILKAAMAASVCDQFSLNIRVVGALMAPGLYGGWESALVHGLTSTDGSLLAGLDDSAKALMQPIDRDHSLELFDRCVLAIRLGGASHATPLHQPAGLELIGYLAKDGRFTRLPETSDPLIEPKVTSEHEGLYQAVKAIVSNPEGVSRLNLGMSVRAAWRRLHGLEVKMAKDALI